MNRLYSSPCKAARLGLILSAALLTSLSADSLWKDDTSPDSMFADKKAHRIGDILTVIVQENNGATRNNNLTTAKQTSVNAAISSFGYGAPATGFLTKNGQYPSIGFSGKNTYNGGGTIGNQETINSMIAVKVIDVLPNGNLVIEGRRQTAFSGEKQDAILRGIVRRDDISATNSVYSVNIADATIQFLNRGTITDAQNKGWFNRVWDKVNPF